MAEPKNDWETIRDIYVNTRISKSALAERFGVSRKSVIRHSIAEDWDTLKAEKNGVRVPEAVSPACHGTPNETEEQFLARMRSANRMELAAFLHDQIRKDRADPKSTAYTLKALMEAQRIFEDMYPADTSETDNSLTISFMGVSQAEGEAWSQ